MAALSFAGEDPIVRNFYTDLSPDERTAFAAYYLSVRNRRIDEGTSEVFTICIDTNEL